jgi:hypothetical protein
MAEYNLLEVAGLSQVKVRERASNITESDKPIAEGLDFSFYDGDRSKGYGGYFYDGRWQKVAEVAKKRYNLTSESRVLVDRCHKGFLVYDLKKLIPGITVFGIHPKPYALNHTLEGFGLWFKRNNSEDNRGPKTIEEEAKSEVSPFLIQTNSDEIPFKDNFFDTVISIENACAYPYEQCKNVVREIVRVSKANGKNSYIQNDSWRNESERDKLKSWTLLCKTFLDIPQWEELFEQQEYKGDWGYTIIS